MRARISTRYAQILLLVLLVACGALLGAMRGSVSRQDAAAQSGDGVTEEWVRRYNGPGNSSDFARAIAVDGAGNAYVTGYSYGSGSSYDYATFKYGPDGSEQWVRRYNGPSNSEDRAWAIAVDGVGNTYVTGYSYGSGSSYDYLTIKYGPEGSEQWVRRYDGPSNSVDVAYAIAVDGEGSVYVTGYSSSGVAGSADYSTIKYGPDGSEDWVRRYNGPGNGDDLASAIAVDGAGNAYVTGASPGSGSLQDYATIKYGPNGSEDWVRRYNGPAKGDDGASAVAVDGAGNAYVTGYSHGSDGPDDYATIKYGPDGSEDWVRRYNGPAKGDDGAHAIHVDGARNVYVTGSSAASDGYGDYATIKYGPDGSEDWVRRYNGPANSYDRANAIAVDGAANVYVTGCSRGSVQDYATIRYGPDGSEDWVRRYNGPGNSDDYASAVAVDGAGDVYVTGASVGSGSSDDYATIKYSQAGGPTPTLTPTPTETPTPPAPVVVLVHGYDWNSDNPSCGMEPLEQYIHTPANMGGQTFETVCLPYRTRDGVVAGAKVLQQKINASGRDKVDIVAHSMGGLVARYYIEKLGGKSKVRSLTMLGTPNWGTEVAVPMCVFSMWRVRFGGTFDRAACDLIPASPVILALNLFPGSHAGVLYNVITGWVGNRLLKMPNDCAVTEASAMGLGFETTLLPVSHVKVSGAASVSGCTATGEIEDAGVHSHVRDILLAANNLAAPAEELAGLAMETPTPPPDEPAPDALTWQNGVIANGNTVEAPVIIPDGEASTTFQFQVPSSADVTLAYSLLRPGGAPVNQGDPDVSFVAGPAFGDFDETRYVITTPTQGIWVMRVVGTSVPTGGWPYELRALVAGRISVAASVGSDHFIVGEPVAVNADVAIAGTPVADATVSATVTKPGGTSAAVPLAGGGTGTYSGSFADTSECGVYQVLVTASGTDGATPFSRQDLTLAVVSVPGEPGANPCEAAAPVVGGIAEAPDVAGSASGSSSPPYAALAGAVVGGVVVLAAGGWYARRRCAG